MLAFYAQMELDEGFDYLSIDKKERPLLFGLKIDRAAGFKLFTSLKHGPIRCWECGMMATCWVVGRGKNDKIGHPCMNLYGFKNGVLTMMTQDHIVPRSLGGNSELKNLRPGCEKCNSVRGNQLCEEDLNFMLRNRDAWHYWKFNKNFGIFKKKYGEDSLQVAPFKMYITAVQDRLRARNTALVAR